MLLSCFFMVLPQKSTRSSFASADPAEAFCIYLVQPGGARTADTLSNPRVCTHTLPTGPTTAQCRRFWKSSLSRLPSPVEALLQSGFCQWSRFRLKGLLHMLSPAPRHTAVAYSPSWLMLTSASRSSGSASPPLSSPRMMANGAPFRPG